jgi:NifU-like protein involved in Fe-S cluster formation
MTEENKPSFADTIHFTIKQSKEKKIINISFQKYTEFG